MNGERGAKTRGWREERLVDWWNAAHPIGTTVRVWLGLREGEGIVTKTTGLANVLGDTAVVPTQANAYVALSHVEVVTVGGDFARYRRSKIVDLRPWTPDLDMARVSIGAADKAAGSPKLGDMIARDPNNYDAQWLVPAAHFADHYEPIAAPSRAELVHLERLVDVYDKVDIWDNENWDGPEKRFQLAVNGQVGMGPSLAAAIAHVSALLIARESDGEAKCARRRRKLQGEAP